MTTAALPREQWACPRCHLALFEGRTHDVTMHACGHCGGLWVDNQGSAQVTSKLSAAAFDLANKATNAARAVVATAGEGLACPECRIAMGRQHFAPAHLDVDICAQHGVSLMAAALQFPLAHPATTAVIPGGKNAEEVEQCVAAMNCPIPAALWAALRAAGLIPAGMPVPAEETVAAARL